MNSVLGKVAQSILSSVNVFQSQIVPVRYRYYAEKIARGPYARKYGYKEKIFTEGVLPRLKDADPLPGPVYRPQNAWSRKRALMGQNDYIDLLGGGKLRPPDVGYDVPKWLRGRKGDEMKLLLLKQKVYRETLYQYENPTMWEKSESRIKYLYRYLNRKTKTGLSKQ